MATKFWKDVEELAKLRDQIPEERRAGSGVRQLIYGYSLEKFQIQRPIKGKSVWDSYRFFNQIRKIVKK